METKPLETAGESSYREFLSGHENSLLYYSLKYRDMLVELLECESKYLVAEDNGKVAGILPLMVKHGEYGSVVNSLPFYGSNGGILAADENAYRLLLGEYNRIAGSDRTAAATLVANPLETFDYHGISHDMTDKRIGQWTPLPGREDPGEKLMGSFHYKTRNMIRKAQKSGVTVKIDNTAMEFIKHLHKRNMAAIGGKPKPDRFFTLVERHFLPTVDYDIYTASKDGQFIAGLLVFYFNRTVEYFTPVTEKVYRNVQPLSAIIYRAMIDAAQRGFTWWNWGGTWVTQEGVYRFKKRWGTVDKEYTYYTRINDPEIYNRSKEELLRVYDNFYVVDFKKL